MFVMGTAGHVDHGKSSLVIALSGIDPDRLPEEKVRGLTIDLGFAWMTTASGETVGIVDVPGHERFVKNMIAGVGAIDFVLFVVAADDGWMPQTTEHLAILEFLNVQRGITVITKKGLVDPDWLGLVEDDVREKLKGTFLDGAPRLLVDSLSGDGIAALKTAIDEITKSLPVRPDIGRPRLYIDRAFAIAGRGAVVTGTLIEGQLMAGQSALVVPGPVKARVRELQVHGHSVPVAAPGQRVAVNLAGVELGQLRRGQCVVGEDDTVTVDRLWADIHVLPEMTHPLKAGRRLLVMIGTAEPEGVAYPVDPAGIAPGRSGICELRLLAPVKARLRDHLVLRWPTPELTVGGGTILDVGGTRHWRRLPGFIERMNRRRLGTIASYRETELTRDGFAARAGFLSMGPFSPAEIDHDLREASATGKVVIAGAWLFDPVWLKSAEKRMLGVLDTLHMEQPYAAGMNLSEWQKKSGVAVEVMPALVGLLEQEGRVARTSDAYHRPGHRPGLPSAWDGERDRLWSVLTSAGMQPPTRTDLETASDNARQILGFWLARGDVVALPDNVVFPADTFTTIRRRVVDFLKDSESMTAAQLRDLLGTTRRYAVPILETLDKEGTTRRVGDLRVLATADATEE